MTTLLEGRSAAGSGGVPRSRRDAIVLLAILVVPLAAWFLVIGAIPAYRDHAVRAEVAEGVALATPARDCVASVHTATGAMPQSNADCGLDAPSQLGGRYTESVTVAGGGLIVVRFLEEGASPTIAGHTLTFEATVTENRIRWDCTGGTVESRHRPSVCR